MKDSSALIGIICVVCGLGALMGQDVIMKDLVSRYPVMEMMFLRGVFSLVALQFFLPFLYRGNPLKSQRKILQIFRGTLQFLSFCCYYVALSRMALLELVTIIFSAPLFAVAMSAIFLREPVKVRHWVAVLVGFTGALLILRPGSIHLDQAIALFALAAAALYGASIVVTRSLGETESGVTTAYYTLIMYAALAGAGTGLTELLLNTPDYASAVDPSLAWRTPRLMELGLLLVAGTAVCGAFLLLAHAYRLAPVSNLAPWEYSALMWGGLFGFLFFGEVPTVATLCGAALIVASGVSVSRSARS